MPSCWPLLDQAKKSVMYRKPLDEEREKQWKQLLADDCWVIEQVAMLIGVSEEQLRRANIEKLDTGENARYKEGYSDEAAQARADKEVTA